MCRLFVYRPTVIDRVISTQTNYIHIDSFLHWEVFRSTIFLYVLTLFGGSKTLYHDRYRGKNIRELVTALLNERCRCCCCYCYCCYCWWWCCCCYCESNFENEFFFKRINNFKNKKDFDYFEINYTKIIPSYWER